MEYKKYYPYYRSNFGFVMDEKLGIEEVQRIFVGVIITILKIGMKWGVNVFP